MGPHDVAHVDSTRGLVVLVCNCGHRAEATTKAQADEKHEAHRWIAQMRQDRKGSEAE